jgi:SHS2 domain-containing protein
MPIEELPHTADVMFRITADRTEGIFEDATRAMFQAMYGSCSVNPTVEKEISLSAEDLEMLLVDFLSELLFLSEVEYLVICDATVRLDKTSLTATVRGEPFDPARHFGREIKGVSFSNLRIYKQGDAYVLDIIFDV